MIILVSEVRRDLFDDELPSIFDRLLQGVVGTYLGCRLLLAAVLSYRVEGRYVVVSY